MCGSSNSICLFLIGQAETAKLCMPILLAYKQHIAQHVQVLGIDRFQAAVFKSTPLSPGPDAPVGTGATRTYTDSPSRTQTPRKGKGSKKKKKNKKKKKK